MLRNNQKIYREIAISLLGSKCEFCGTDKKLLFHHKDKNFNNNSKENIQLLCKECHGNMHSVKEVKKKDEFFYVCDDCCNIFITKNKCSSLLLFRKHLKNKNCSKENRKHYINFDDNNYKTSCPFCREKIFGKTFIKLKEKLEKHVISNLDMHLSMRHKKENSEEILEELRREVQDD